MAVLEVRRHAERAGPAHPGSALSPAGRSMAERLALRAPAYALVVASPLPRAKETAAIIGGRLDSADPALLPDLSQLVQARTIEEYAALLADGGRERAAADGERARALADEQAGAWARIADTAGEGTALVITHGGVLELAASRLAAAVGTALRGAAFSYCEGVRVRYERGRVTGLDVLRA
jgi:broad specificity phosphatase PhoE